jgi:DNA-3-methyladenine glycosylase
LARSFFDRPTPLVARELLGCLLVHELEGGRRIGRVVETEAYDGPGDRANHASRSRTPRNEVMFGRPGFAYVYLVYGLHRCLNAVTGPVGYPAAVLLRAIEPLEGLEGSASGPGRLTRAMGVEMRHDRADLVEGCLYLARDRSLAQIDVGVSARVGVDYAGEWADSPLRFFSKTSEAVSRPPRRRRRMGGRSR